MSELIAESKLKRFLLYGSEDIVYIPGSRFQYEHCLGKNLASLRSLLNEVEMKKIFQLLKYVQNEKLASHEAIVPLVMSECCKISGWKEEALEFALIVLRTDQEFLIFCKFSYEILPDIGVGPLVTNFIQKWYSSRHYWDLVEIVSERPSCYGWLHRDVIKLGNVKFSCPKRAAVMAYTYGGVELMNQLFANDGEAQEVVDHLNRVEAFKSETDPDKAVIEIGAYMHTIHTTNETLLEHRQVWKALIRQMNLVELLDRLPTIRNKGFLRCPVLFSWDPHFVPHLCDRLGSLGAVIQSKINPSKSCIEHQRWKNSYQRSSKNYYKPKSVNQDVLCSLKEQMEHALKKNVSKGTKNVTVIIDSYSLPSSRCTHEPDVRADIAAAVAALHLARSSAKFKMLIFKGHRFEVGEPTATLDDVLSHIGSDPPDVPSTKEIGNYLSPKNNDVEDTDLFAVIGLRTNYEDYVKIVQDHQRDNTRSPKFAFCGLGDVCVDRQFTYEKDVILSYGFDDKMCHIIAAFSKI